MTDYVSMYFDEHVENVRRMARESLHRTRCSMSNVGGTKCEVAFMLYEACVWSNLLIAFLVWCTTSINNLWKLESVQWRGIMHAGVAVNGTPVSALKVLSGIPQLHLRREESILLSTMMNEVCQMSSWWTKN